MWSASRHEEPEQAGTPGGSQNTGERLEALNKFQTGRFTEA